MHPLCLSECLGVNQPLTALYGRVGQGAVGRVKLWMKAVDLVVCLRFLATAHRERCDVVTVLTRTRHRRD